METNETLIQACLDAGAFKASVIDVAQIPFDEELRKYCEANSCGCYDSNYACPPCCGTPEEVMTKAKSYQKALVFQTVWEIEDSYDFDGMQDAGKKHAVISSKLNKELRERLGDYLLLTAGGCSICPVCARKDNLPCRFPEQAFSSLEAYCMNVSTLAPICDMKYINGQNTVTYFSAFLYR